jgi:hypothetical protein
MASPVLAPRKVGAKVVESKARGDSVCTVLMKRAAMNKELTPVRRTVQWANMKAFRRTRSIHRTPCDEYILQIYYYHQGQDWFRNMYLLNAIEA